MFHQLPARAFIIKDGDFLSRMIELGREAPAEDKLEAPATVSLSGPGEKGIPVRVYSPVVDR